MITVFTGWRKISPGKCWSCGSTEDWDCDGRGTIYCSCQTCEECFQWDGHTNECEIGQTEWLEQQKAMYPEDFDE